MSVSPIKPIQLMQSSQSSQFMHPLQSTQSVQATQSSQLTQSMQPLQSTQLSQSVQSVQSLQSILLSIVHPFDFTINSSGPSLDARGLAQEQAASVETRAIRSRVPAWLPMHVNMGTQLLMALESRPHLIGGISQEPRSMVQGPRAMALAVRTFSHGSTVKALAKAARFGQRVLEPSELRITNLRKWLGLLSSMSICLIALVNFIVYLFSLETLLMAGLKVETMGTLTGACTSCGCVPGNVSSSSFMMSGICSSDKIIVYLVSLEC